MSEDLKMYLSTGEVSKLFNISKKTLFHYDNIGLFKPEKVLPNGYRYYSHYQLELLNVIYILKEINLPLADIKGFLDKRNLDNSIEFLEDKKNEIEEEIQRLKRMQDIISNKIKIIKEGKSFNEQITLENQEEEYLLLSSRIDNNKKFYDIDSYTSLIKYCNMNKLNIGYPVGGIINKENLEENIYDEYDYYFIKVEKNYLNDKILVKPKGLYIVGYSIGYYDKIPNLYNKLKEYINNNNNNLKIIGSSYEQLLIDEVASKDINDYIIKISIQVEYK